MTGRAAPSGRSRPVHGDAGQGAGQGAHDARAGPVPSGRPPT